MQGLASSVLSSDSRWAGYKFRHHPDISEENLSSGSEKSADYTDYDEDGLELDSNHSNSDIIPFSEGEYEKITVETDCQTDGEQTGRLSVGSSGSSSLGTGKSGKTSGCDTDGIDSALGRSVSDDRVSVSTETQANVAAHCSILLTHDPVNKPANKVVSFAQEEEDQKMRSGPKSGTMVSSKPASPGVGSKVKAEPHDIGYSSESHSNDEPDDGHGNKIKVTELATQTDTNSNNKSTFTTSSPIPPKHLMSLDNVVLRKKALIPGHDTGSSSEQNEADNTPSPTSADKSWRHSMTSAYDTSSNCSDLNNQLDLDMTLDATTSCDTSVCTIITEDPGLSSGADVHLCDASPRKQFYSVVAGIESDSSAYSTAIHCLNKSHDGASSDVNSSKNEFSKGCINHSTPIKHNDTELSSPFIGSASAKMLQLGDPWRQISKGQWPRTERSASLSVQQDSDASSREADLNAEDFAEIAENPREEQATSCESIKRLIQQAELLVRDTDLLNIPSNKSWVRRRKRLSSKSSSLSKDNVLPSTDLSPNPTDRDSNNISSCDASSEGSSESDGDYSTASSELDDQYISALPSLTTSHSGHSGFMSSTSSGSTLLNRTYPSYKPSRGDRPWSVTELYELTNRLDLSPFSISESAIDELSKKHNAMQTSPSQRLRRTTSDMSSHQRKKYETPLKARKRKLKRSASDDHEQVTSTATVTESLHATPRSFDWRSTSYYSQSSVERSASGSETIHLPSVLERLPTASPLPEQARHGNTDSELDVAGELIQLMLNAFRSET